MNVLEAMTVSRQHALLLRDAAGLRLVALESTNGTLVNGVPAPPDEAVHLADGDEIRLGQVVARYSAPPQDDGDRRAPQSPDFNGSATPFHNHRAANNASPGIRCGNAGPDRTDG